MLLLLDTAVGRSNFVITPRVDFSKIQVTTHEQYRTLTDKLIADKIDHYTFGASANRTQHVVLRGLPHNVGHELVKQELIELGYPVRSISAMKSPQDRSITMSLLKLNLSIAPGAPLAEFSQLTRLLGCIVSCEEPRESTRTVTQICHNCQKPGHVALFCRTRPACARCAQAHNTRNCKMNPTTEEYKCANCGGAHPASLQSCPFLKDVRRRKAETAAKTNPSSQARSYAPQGTTRSLGPACETARSSTNAPRRQLDVTTPTTPQPQRPAPVAQPRALRSPVQPGVSYTDRLTAKLRPVPAQVERTVPETSSHVPAPKQNQTPAPVAQADVIEEPFNWKAMAITLADFLIEAQLHPTVTQLARMAKLFLARPSQNAGS
jgi:hypothetical protein